MFLLGGYYLNSLDAPHEVFEGEKIHYYHLIIVLLFFCLILIYFLQVFEGEKKVYRDEGLDDSAINFTDNAMVKEHLEIEIDRDTGWLGL